MKDLVKQVVDKQIKIIEEQQQKAQEFIGKRVCICKTWKTYKAMPHLHITKKKKNIHLVSTINFLKTICSIVYHGIETTLNTG